MVLILKIKIIGGCLASIEMFSFYPNQRFLTFLTSPKVFNSILSHKLMLSACVKVFIADYFFRSSLTESSTHADLEVINIFTTDFSP